jgi:serine/threonine protein kinase
VNEKVETFCTRKLTYFYLKAMEFLCYLHSQNVYFGDMKPENLLLFRNYQIKLGDFGVSFKLDESIDENEEVYLLSGLTQEYSLLSIKKKFANDE